MGASRLKPAHLIGAALLLPLALLGLLQARRLQQALRVGGASAAQARRYEQRPARPRMRVLLLGDSTGVGVGAAPEQTLAARLARDCGADTELVNACRNGATMADVAAQLSEPAAAPVDLIVLHVGGNDILRGTPLAELDAEAARLLPRLRQRARRAVWLGPANIGLAPVFLPPFSWWLSHRTRRACDRFERSARRFGVRFIDFYAAPDADRFSAEPDRYFAPDRVHPSSESYRFCYQVLRRALSLPDPRPRRG